MGVDRSAHEIFITFGDVPSPFDFEITGLGGVKSDQVVLDSRTLKSVPTSFSFAVIRNRAVSADVTITAEALPLADHGCGNRHRRRSRFRHDHHPRFAQFDENAIVKFVRPGIAEVLPVRQVVVDSTKIVAIFSFEDLPHGLYDVKVTNPDGEAGRSSLTATRLSASLRTT